MDKKEEIRAILEDAMPADDGSQRPITIIGGSGDGTGIGNTINNTTINITPSPPKITTVVKTGDGVLTAQQKAELKTLVADWIAASVVRKKPKTYASAWNGLNKHMKVNSYAEIKQEDFDKAVAWLRKQIGTCKSMRSAPKKIPTWRTDKMKAIHARSKEYGLEEWRLSYMVKRFGKPSMKELSDDDLQALYSAVFHKKPSEP
jgi:hypothetical protein